MGYKYFLCLGIGMLIGFFSELMFFYMDVIGSNHIRYGKELTEINKNIEKLIAASNFNSRLIVGDEKVISQCYDTRDENIKSNVSFDNDDFKYLIRESLISYFENDFVNIDELHAKLNDKYNDRKIDFITLDDSEFSLINNAISKGSWSKEDQSSLVELQSTLTKHQAFQLNLRLVQAINHGDLEIEDFPF